MSKEQRGDQPRGRPTRRPIDAFAGHNIYGGHRAPEYTNPKFERWVMALEEILDAPDGDIKIAKMFRVYSPLAHREWTRSFWDTVPEILDDYKLQRELPGFAWHDLNGLFQIYQIECAKPHFWAMSRIALVDDKGTRELLLRALKTSGSLDEFAQKIGELYMITTFPDRADILSTFKAEFEAGMANMTFDQQFIPGREEILNELPIYRRDEY